MRFLRRSEPPVRKMASGHVHQLVAMSKVQKRPRTERWGPQNFEGGLPAKFWLITHIRQV